MVDVTLEARLPCEGAAEDDIDDVSCFRFLVVALLGDELGAVALFGRLCDDGAFFEDSDFSSEK